jgi:hypothetical protein
MREGAPNRIREGSTFFVEKRLQLSDLCHFIENVVYLKS